MSMVSGVRSMKLSAKLWNTPALLTWPDAWIFLSAARPAALKFVAPRVGR